ncbi:glyoxalase [Mycolicibacterium novocastrense]|uniref:Glyoxalase/bleomycin resistance protein/dioxygenase n=1 Tax=Mycolicibacterium novocastrense TaxID=59813 RepID=A0AAW5STI1_MYCNV|nr:VOC family protein [Mycolicibacterium novocastrense]KUH67959.1 glyoxalase [Mycolicibacterium novocastrense]KUH68431.1 glyoxalase [Mycolicibacterium novocastrense]KUH73512.1 glyoxalase [Mycolicibacterium novocastrense]MCV7027124.1 VOC family protein [Mycolicibacterium novocastrense]GAT07754.1 glyoxalase/bleomycin resistance protein/dioxygenase [Mycolicibacterium novocastrense]
MNNSHDPLAVLRGDELPVTPDPAFAAGLRARLESALSLPNRTEEVVMSGTDTAIAELSEPSVESTLPRSAALPYLTVRNARDAIAWYVEALDATVVGEPFEMDDGRIGHAELAIGDGVLYLADEYPEIGLRAPARQSVSVSLMLRVADTDASLERARRLGAEVQREPYENYGARSAAIVDPFGHRWMLTGPVTATAVPIQHGDVGYVSVWVPDADRAAVFYGHVLGWTYDPATHQVTNTDQRIGIFSSDRPQGMLCCYAVTDLDGARQSIIDGGGTVGQSQEFDFGSVLDATDPAGTAFAVFRPVPGIPRPALNGTGPGELSYITYQVPSSGAFKEFYSRFLFWTFEPGRIDDGWGVRETHPMAGVAGGNADAVTVPMWSVADIDAAVARVREAGGTVIEEPSQQSYGKSALCTDDQGTRFYLGEL